MSQTIDHAHIVGMHMHAAETRVVESDVLFNLNYIFTLLEY